MTKQEFFKMIGNIFSFAVLIPFIYCSFVRYQGIVSLFGFSQLILDCFTLCLFIMMSFLLTLNLPNQTKVLGFWIHFFFICYLFFVFRVLFLSDFRSVPKENGLNLIPFRTILLFLRGYLHGFVNLYHTVLNLFGNLILFLPVGVFLPIHTKSMRKFLIFAPTVFFLILLCELLQLFFHIGYCDIDDLLLNFIGCCAGFSFFMHGISRSLREKIFAICENNY